MRFMLMVKANKNSEAGILPDEQLVWPKWGNTTRRWSKPA